MRLNCVAHGPSLAGGLANMNVNLINVKADILVVLTMGKLTLVVYS